MQAPRLQAQRQHDTIIKVINRSFECKLYRNIDNFKTKITKN